MNFRTQLPIPQYLFDIGHTDRLFCMGSCFAEHIGQRLIAKKFSTVLNPFGILYNPISIEKGLRILLNDEQVTENNIIEHQGLWHSFYHHGQFSQPTKEALLRAIAESLTPARQSLPQTNRLLLTFGTAFVFEHQEQGKVVANCHKLPASQFERRRLTVEEIEKALLPLFQKLKQQQQDLEIILTVSPVRHLRDGFIENQRSKATLLLAVDELSKQLDFVNYFPAYELLLDDLRDYRFFAQDMLHPSEVAVDYVWNYFSAAFFDKETAQLNTQLEKLRQAVQHRPFRPESEAHQRFVQQQLEKISELEKQQPQLDFSEERRVLEGQQI